jgi:IS30 family transposase
MSNLKNNILKLRDEGKTYSEISKLLNCAKSTISYYCKLYGKSTIISNKINNSDILLFQELYDNYHSVNKVAFITNRSKSTILKYVKTIKRNKQTYDEIKKNNIKYVNNFRKRLKIKSVDYKGGKCIKCGYNKCIAALEFHHRNPNNKDFEISSSKILSWNKIKIELDKCDLVCSNCHKEIHWDVSPLPDKQLEG